MSEHNLKVFSLDVRGFVGYVGSLGKRFCPRAQEVYYMRADKNNFYTLKYRDPESGRVASLKCTHIEDSPLGLGFVKVSGFVFESSILIAKPSEEQLKKRLENVKTMHLSLYSILSIEEKGETKGLKLYKNRSHLVIPLRQ